MKTRVAVLTAALLFSITAVAGDRKSSPPGQAKAPASTVTTTRAVDADPYRHGRTVRETAQRDDLAKPRGESIRQVAQTQRDFKGLDANSDGTLIVTELAVGSDLRTRFTTFDTNLDGKLSHTEYDAYIVAGLDDDD